MTETDRGFCDRAIAYLKVAIVDNNPAIEVTGPDEPVLRAVGNGLPAAYLVDVGFAFRYVQRRHLLGANVTADELHNRAVANLLDFSRDRLEIRPYQGIFAVLLGGNFEASLLLAGSLWDDRLAHLAPNGFVAAAPARDLLAFCDASSEGGIIELRAVITRAEAAGVDHALTPTLLRRHGKSWVRYAL
ncbi:MAG TPA: hypothetical protein VFE41_15205 [Acetobacteraceae bacterium]|jgi:hypothetical protein|nr:hypothetical protein [Acetobacteraceae bacterium]